MTTATETTDQGLLRRMIAGDEEAFTLLYRRRHAAIYRFALHVSGSPAVAEDVTQEVFLMLIRDAKRFDPARGSVSAFLFGVARNFLRKRWEQDRRVMPFADGADELGQTGSSGGEFAGAASGNGARGKANGNGAGTSSGDELASLETIGRVRQAIATLPESYREVVVLCDLEEMSYDEAASALGCPVGTVRSRLHRARAILLEKLRDARPEGWARAARR